MYFPEWEYVPSTDLHWFTVRRLGEKLVEVYHFCAVLVQ
jgi:hypothetical protein